MKALEALLKSLLRQELGDIELELMICNNSSRIYLKKSRFSKIGRLLRTFSDVKIVNSSFNWRCKIRYTLSTLAKYDTILFLDDDIVLIDPNFIRYMFTTFQKLRSIDILSCWNTLWVDCNDDFFVMVPLIFESPEITVLTQSDTCGPGICMLGKQLLMNSKILNMHPQAYPLADDMALSIIASMECGSRSYYLPSYGLLKFHKQHLKGALHKQQEHYDDLYSLYKFLWKKGYKTVLSRLSYQISKKKSTPESHAAQTLQKIKRKW